MKRAVALVALLAGCTSIEFAPRRSALLDRAAASAQVDPSASALASSMPAPGTAEAPHAALAGEAKLSNGIRVLLLESHRIPLVAVGVVLARGTIDAPPGVFRLFVDEMSSGSDLISPKALYRNLYEYGARRATVVRKESSSVEVQFVALLADEIIPMVVPTFATPTFDSDEFDALLDAHKRQVSRTRDEPHAAASRALYKLIYPAGHPLADDETDGPTPLAGVTLDTVRALRDVVGSDDVSVVVAGDITMAQVTPMLEKALGTLNHPARPRKTFPDVVAPASAHVVAIDHPGDSQAQIALGFSGVKCDDPDYAALFALSKIIQDAAWSALRLGHGLTYGVSASIAMMREPAPLILTAAVDVARVPAALRDTFDTLTTFETRIKKPGELQRLKNWMLASWPDTSDTVDESIRKLEPIASLGLPVDTWVKLRDAVQALTADDLGRVAKQYLDPARAQLVVLGDVAKFRPALDALKPSMNVTEIEVRSAH